MDFLYLALTVVAGVIFTVGLIAIWENVHDWKKEKYDGTTNKMTAWAVIVVFVAAVWWLGRFW